MHNCVGMIVVDDIVVNATLEISLVYKYKAHWFGSAVYYCMYPAISPTEVERRQHL